MEISLSHNDIKNTSTYRTTFTENCQTPVQLRLWERSTWSQVKREEKWSCDHIGTCASRRRFMKKKKSENEVAQLCPTLCNHMDCSLPGFSIHGIFQARVLEWVAISFSKGSSRPRDRAQVSHIAGRCFAIWAASWKGRLCGQRGDEQLGPLIGSPGHEVLHRENEPPWLIRRPVGLTGGCRKPVLRKAGRLAPKAPWRGQIENCLGGKPG